MSGLSSRVALVTGGAGGIGAASAMSLAGNGAAVLVGDIVDASATVRAIRDAGGSAEAVHLDVAAESSWADVLTRAVEAFGGLDILVNNAGVTLVKPLFDTTLQEFRSVQRVNVDGVFLGMKLAIPLIAQRAHRWGGGGAVINISSTAGIVGSRSAIAYNASKAAVRLMTKSAALECSALELNVRVNSVHPGRINTEMLAASSRGFAGVARPGAVAATGEPEDIGGVVAFLASDDARFMTGAEVVVDGGFTAQ